MASAYASPPRSTRAMSPTLSTSASAPKSIESSMQALSQPPPTLRDILYAYASQGQGDRALLIALLNAKSSEDNRIAAVAALQQNILGMQMSAVLSQLQARPRAPESSEMDDMSSPLLSPSPPAARRHARTGSQPAYKRVHPYAKARPERRASADGQMLNGESSIWGPRKSWDCVSDERSTSDEHASGKE